MVKLVKQNAKKGEKGKKQYLKKWTFSPGGGWLTKSNGAPALGMAGCLNPMVPLPCLLAMGLYMPSSVIETLPFIMLVKSRI